MLENYLPILVFLVLGALVAITVQQDYSYTEIAYAAANIP